MDKTLELDDKVNVEDSASTFSPDENFHEHYRRLSKIRVNIMRDSKNRFAFWGGLLLLGKTFVDRRYPTAATDGFNTYYNPVFIETLNDKELAFVVLHEVSHVAFKHLYIWKKLFQENPKIANKAADYVINYLLVETDPNGEVIKIPAIGLYDARFAGMNTKTVYDILKNEAENDEQGFDEHILSGENIPEDFLKELDSAIKIARCKPGNPFSREFGEISAPQEKWEDKLREYALNCVVGNSESSWRKLSRRFVGQGYFLPSSQSDSIPNIVCAIDTSGSIGTQELTAVLSEVIGIAQSVDFSELNLLYWDTSVRSHERYDSSSADSIIAQSKPKGGGGTDVSCVFDYLKKEDNVPSICIVLTDGFTGWPTEPPEYPIIFVLTTDAVPPFGNHVRIFI